MITYSATGQRGLGRHVDGDGKQTLLVTLDDPADYVGGRAGREGFELGSRSSYFGMVASARVPSVH